MNKASERSLNAIKSMVERDDGFKRYMRVNEAMRNYQLDRKSIMRIALDAGALYKINTVTLVDMDIFEQYFEENFKVKKEDLK